METHNQRKISPYLENDNPTNPTWNPKTREKSSIYFGFRILGNFYRFTGLAIYKDRRTAEELHFEWRTVWFWALYSATLWCFILTCIILFIMAFVKVWNENKQAVDLTKLFNVGLVFHLSGNYLIMVAHTAVQSRGMLRLVKALHRLELDLCFTLKQKWLVAILAIFLMLCHLLYCIRTFLNMTNDYNNIIFKVFSVSITTRLVLTICCWIWTMTTIAAIFMIPTWLVFLSIFFRRCFNTVRIQLQTISDYKCSETPCNCGPDVQTARNFYLRSLEILGECNGMMSVGVLINYSANIILCCFAIFLAVRDTDHTEVVIFLELFITGLIRMIVPLIAVGAMQGEEQRLSNDIRKLCLNSQCNAFMQELEIFKANLQSEKVTFTGCGIFYLNLPFILSIIQTILTYAVILIQTQPNQFPAFNSTMF